MEAKHKFYVLRFVASVHIIIGELACVGAILIFFLGLDTPAFIGFPAAIFSLWLFICGLMLIVVGELCYVLLGIEANTRMTNLLLEIYHKSNTINPTGNPTEEENQSKESIREIISSTLNWNKEKSIAVGLIIILVIVFFVLKQLGIVQ